MKIYVTGHSALWFWRANARNNQLRLKRCSFPSVQSPASIEELRTIHIPEHHFGTPPIRLMVPNEQYRFMRGHFSYSVHTRPLPEDAFYEISEHLCVASPEYVLVNASRHLSMPQVLQLCMELTGYYAIRQDAKRGLVTREFPLTNIRRIQHLLEQLDGEPGSKQLRRILKFACERSRSPMETDQFLLMSSLRRFGGHGLKGMKINARIDLTPNERQLANRAYLECDMYWPSHGVVIEYDGEEDHSLYASRSKDANKRNILVNQGKRVFILTKHEVFDSQAFDSLVLNIARLTHQRLTHYPDDWEKRRDRLRAELFARINSGDALPRF